jgi:eukaryotic-like serine/threonine-protein kinase
MGSANVLADRYRLDACIAIGGMGQVWRGRDLALRRPVAIKLMKDKADCDPQAAARFKAEARYAGQVCHRGIAKVYDFCETARPFLVMELLEGPSLAQVISAGPLAPGRALEVTAQVAWALQAAHRAGIVHQDVKPANLVFSRDGQVKLTDFGIACRIGSAPAICAGTISGTSAYLAPERLAGANAAPASDLYSLGVVLHECLSGTRPFTGTAREMALAHQLRPPPPLPASVPAPVADLASQLMLKDPRSRPRSAAVVADRAARLRTRFRGPGEPARLDRASAQIATALDLMLGPTLVDIFA